jgi:hypothetical protein
MGDGAGDGNSDRDALERLRHTLGGIDPDATARMDEGLQPRGRADLSDVNARFPWLGVIVIAVGVAVLVLLAVVLYLGAQSGERLLPVGPFGR